MRGEGGTGWPGSPPAPPDVGSWRQLGFVRRVRQRRAAQGASPWAGGGAPASPPRTRGLGVVLNSLRTPERPGRGSGGASLPDRAHFSPCAMEAKAAARNAGDGDGTAFSWGLLEEGACSGHLL